MQMPVSIKDAENSLTQLRAAIDERRTAHKTRERLAELGKEAARKGEQLREEMGEQFEPAEWNRRCSELQEEQQIAAIHADVRASDARVLEVRKLLHFSLDSLRSRKTAEVFTALDSVPPDVRDETIHRYIGLAESILASGRSIRSKRVSSRNVELARQKRQIREYFIECEKPAYKDFCDRLDAHKVSLPDSVTWRRHMKWANAFEKAEGAVSRWFSGVLNSDN